MADINPVLVKDKRILQITDQVDYAVYSGASQNTYQQFVATTASASNLSFNVNVPSENTVVDRNVLLSATVNFNFVITGVASTNSVLVPGLNDSLQAFALNKLFSTSSVTINNSNVSVNTQDVIDCVLKQIPQEDLQKYQGMTPTMLDGAYKNYTDAQTTLNSPFGGYQNGSLYNQYLGRGSHPIIVNSLYRVSGTTVSQLPVSTGTGDIFYVNCSATLTEPLMCLSPFLFGGDNSFNSQGLVGINSINLVLNVDSTLKRFYSCSVPGNYTMRLGNAQFTVSGTTYGATLPAFSSANLLLNFLSTQPTDLVKAKNCVAYSDFPRYITTLNDALAANNSGPGGTPLPGIVRRTYTSQNIQINQVPDKIFIFARKPMASQTILDSATFIPIVGISVNFSNASGLLSSATQQDLWKMSTENGSQVNWLEFSGYANKYTVSSTSRGIIPTGGGILVINPAKDLSLPPYISNGSLGQFSLNFNITLENNTTSAITPEIVVVMQNSGVFVSQSGSSSIFTGVLSKQMVLDTVSNQEAFDSGDYNRLVGGLQMSSALKAVPRPMKKMGGVMSAGVRSAGRKLDMMAM
jgi:hypothetical protein